MKNLIVGMLLSIGLSASALAAAPAVREQSYTAVGTGTTVSISTSAWTIVPTATSLVGRTEVCVNEPNSNSAFMGAIISTSSVTPGEAITVRPIEIADTEEDRCFPIGDGLYLYLISLHSSAESVHVQERRR